MIYLLQDCYKDQDGKYHDILKIGYSKVSFGESRKSQYDTHNYGYTLISEKEGSLELEGYLHKRLKDYHISLEWFKYDSEVIRIFEETSEDDISDFTSQEELNEYIRYYILHNLVPTPKKLSDLYLEGLLGELEKKSKEYPDLEYDENLLKNEILRVFSLVSSKEKEYFETLDFNSPEILELLSECGLDLPQIAGRQKDNNNPFKNEITIFYKTQNKSVSWENFKSLQDQRRKETEDFLDAYTKVSDSQKEIFLKKIKSGIQVRNYSDDFVAISEKTNQPVYNYLVDISNERAWEVSQRDYQDNISVTKAINNSGFLTGNYCSEADIIVKDFLDNHFYKTGIFREKMKMYCEFMDIYKNDQEIQESLLHKIEDQKYRMYYEYYGTSGCRAVSYQESDLYRGWRDNTKDRSDELERIIYSKFEVSKKYPMTEIKSTIQDIYDALGISRKAKATDLKNYFKITKTTISLPDKTIVNGFKLGPL